MSSQPYLLADQPSELERLQLQSRVWEPSGRRLLDEIGEGRGARVLDVGCGAIGWLRLLSEWVGPGGEVVGADIDGAMLDAARQFVDTEGLSQRRAREGRPLRKQARVVLVRPRPRQIPDRAARSRSGAGGIPCPPPPSGRHRRARGVGYEHMAPEPTCAGNGEADRAHRGGVRAVRRRHVRRTQAARAAPHRRHRWECSRRGRSAAFRVTPICGCRCNSQRPWNSGCCRW